MVYSRECLLFFDIEISVIAVGSPEEQRIHELIAEKSEFCESELLK